MLLNTLKCAQMASMTIKKKLLKKPCYRSQIYKVHEAKMKKKSYLTISITKEINLKMTDFLKFLLVYNKRLC